MTYCITSVTGANILDSISYFLLFLLTDQTFLFGNVLFGQVQRSGYYCGRSTHPQIILMCIHHSCA